MENKSQKVLILEVIWVLKSEKLPKEKKMKELLGIRRKGKLERENHQKFQPKKEAKWVSEEKGKLERENHRKFQPKKEAKWVPEEKARL